MGRPKERPSPLVKVAAFVAIGYAAVFVIMASVMGSQFLTAKGSIGREHLTGEAAKGVMFLVAALIVAAVMLSVGATRLLRSGHSGWVIGPLGAFVAVGCVGETVDLLGTANVASDAVGVGIIVLALIPVVLIVIERRTYRRRQTGPSVDVARH